MSSQVEFESARDALQRHYLDMQLTAPEADGKAWALCAEAAPTALRKPWFSIVAVKTNVATVKITGEIGVNNVTAERLLNALADMSEIILIIDSQGGDSEAALSLYRGFSGRVSECRIVNRCFSAAVIIAFSARKIVIERGARMLVHRPRLWKFTDAPGLRQSAKYLSRIERQMADVIGNRIRQPTSAVLQWFDEGDKYFDSEQAVAVGLADEVIEKLEAPPVDTPFRAAETTDDEQAWRDWLKQWPSVTVRDRDKFLRSMSAWLVFKVKQ